VGQSETVGGEFVGGLKKPPSVVMRKDGDGWSVVRGPGSAEVLTEGLRLAEGLVVVVMVGS
jgi:hypothetical protein